MGFVGIGQNDSGGQAVPSIQSASIVWENAATPTGAFLANTSILLGSQLPNALKGPTNAGMLYTGGGGGTTPGFGQIFPTGRS
jgi:hypothetical protein